MASNAQSVLVVEDEASIASFVSLYLKNAGYDVTTATTGADALRSLERDQPSDPAEVGPADPDAHRTRRGRRQDHRPRGRRRRLHDEALQPARPRPASQVDPAARDAGA